MPWLLRRLTPAVSGGPNGWRVARQLPGRAGSYPPGPPTDPDVRNERLRCLGHQSFGTTLAHPFATLQAPQLLWTILGVGSTYVCSHCWHCSQPIALFLRRRLSQYCHAFSAWRRTSSSSLTFPRIP